MCVWTHHVVPEGGSCIPMPLGAKVEAVGSKVGFVRVSILGVVIESIIRKQGEY